ncbi:MAG: hypothetical protein IIZ28_05260 [Erysipelotrichaceae bacterium]|nr:hypothetical protein [Erysipelotrichaceae bacterium]
MNEEKIKELLEEIGIGVALVFDERKPDFFKKAFIRQPEKDCEALHCEIRLKTDHDEVYVFEGKSRFLSDLQLMYIPSGEAALYFRQWQKDFEPVYLFNDGERDLEIKTPYGTYRLPAGKQVRAHRDEYTYRMNEGEK